MKGELISIVIPVYNVQRYLKKCIESVIKQKYQNVEIILVNDGSTDESGGICDYYAKLDSRIKVIHKKNGGLSEARNFALDIVEGTFITFVDSDDVVTEDYVEYLYEVIKRENADVVISQWKKVYSYNEKINNKKEKIQVYNAEEAIENYLYQKGFNSSAQCKIYKRYIFEDIRYPIGYHYEDMAVICKILAKCSKIVVSNQIKYLYLQRATSIMGSSFSAKKMQRIEVAERIKEYIEKNNVQLINAANARCFLAAIQTYREIPWKLENEIYIKRTWDVIVKYRSAVIYDIKTKCSIKVMALSSFAGKRILYILGYMYSNIFVK